MRRWVLLFLILLVPILGGFGWIDVVDLQDRIIVQGIGIDYEDGRYLVTMQSFSPKGSGGQTVIDSSKVNAGFITCEGRTISEAVSRSALSQGKTYYLGHNQIVVLGESALRLPLEQLLSYLTNSMDARADVNVLVAAGKASDILKASIAQEILPAMAIEETVKTAANNGLASDVLLVDLLQAMAADYRSCAIPVIRAVKTSGGGSQPSEEGNSENELEQVSLDGMAIFSKDLYSGKLDVEGTRGLLFLRDEIKNAVFTLSNEDYAEAAVKLFESRTRIIPSLEEGQIAFQVEIACRGMMEEKMLREGKLYTEASLKRLEKQIEAQIVRECREAFAIVAGEFKSDAFYAGDLVRKDYPVLWREFSFNWQEKLGECAFSVRVDCEIERTGLEELDEAG